MRWSIGRSTNDLVRLYLDCRIVPGSGFERWGIGKSKLYEILVYKCGKIPGPVINLGVA